MKYEETTINNKTTNTKAYLYGAKQLPTWRLALIILDRYKLQLLSLGNIILVLNYMVPEWFTILKSLF